MGSTKENWEKASCCGQHSGRSSPADLTLQLLAIHMSVC